MGYSRRLSMSSSSIFRTQRSNALPAKPTRPLPAIFWSERGIPTPLHPRLLMSAADALEGNAALDALFRQQLTDLLATRLLAAHTGAPTTFEPVMGGLSPTGAATRHRTPALGQRCGRLARGARFGCRPVALPLLPCLQGKHRAFASCLAAPAPARAGHEHAARHRCVDRVGRGGAWLRLANRLRRGVQEADRRNPERLATAHAVAAIALQVRQSLWRSRSSGSLDHHGTHANNRRRQTMTWKTSSAPLQSHRDGESSRPRSCTDFHWPFASLRRRARRWKFRRSPCKGPIR